MEIGMVKWSKNQQEINSFLHAKWENRYILNLNLITVKLKILIILRTSGRIAYKEDLRFFRILKLNFALHVSKTFLREISQSFTPLDHKFYWLKNFSHQTPSLKPAAPNIFHKFQIAPHKKSQINFNFFHQERFYKRSRERNICGGDNKIKVNTKTRSINHKCCDSDIIFHISMLNDAWEF